MEKLNPKQDPSRQEYWSHKLRGEVTYTPTQKNENAINEYCEDIAQSIKIQLKTPTEEKAVGILNMLGELKEDIRKYRNYTIGSNELLETELNEIKKWVWISIGTGLGIIAATLLSIWI